MVSQAKFSINTILAFAFCPANPLPYSHGYHTDQLLKSDWLACCKQTKKIFLQMFSEVGKSFRNEEWNVKNYAMTATSYCVTSYSYTLPLESKQLWLVVHSPLAQSCAASPSKNFHQMPLLPAGNQRSCRGRQLPGCYQSSWLRISVGPCLFSVLGLFAVLGR